MSDDGMANKNANRRNAFSGSSSACTHSLKNDIFFPIIIQSM